MKKLQLKIKDLTNPAILGHHEIKNILGGSGGEGGSGINVYCTLLFFDGQTISAQCQSQICIDTWVDACKTDEDCNVCVCPNI